MYWDDYLVSAYIMYIQKLTRVSSMYRINFRLVIDFIQATANKTMQELMLLVMMVIIMVIIMIIIIIIIIIIIMIIITYLTRVNPSAEAVMNELKN